MEDKKRIEALGTIIALSFALGILLSNRLWIAVRLYPLDPIFKAFSALPPWFDYLLTPLLLIALLLATLSKHPRKYIIASVALAAFLFMEDQGRLFPSFYEYSLLFLILAFYTDREQRDGKAGAILNVCRLAIVFIYFWSGAQKINPLFENQLSLVLAPLTNAVPILRGSFVVWMSALAPFLEMEIGVALLFKKTRNLAVVEALLMHGMLFFFIGPFRGTWNESAWLWNLSSAFIVFILFYRTDEAGAKEILFEENIRGGLLSAGVLVVFGILPALNFINLWDSALSFNVFSGNVTQARMYLSDGVVGKLAPPLQQYVETVGSGTDTLNIFNLEQWSEDELHAEPYPEPRAFKNIAAAFCVNGAPADVRLIIHNKLSFFETPDEAQSQTYTCANL